MKLFASLKMSRTILMLKPQTDGSVNSIGSRVKYLYDSYT